MREEEKRKKKKKPEGHLKKFLANVCTHFISLLIKV